jgi:16S rRNA processing protein RimM
MKKTNNYPNEIIVGNIVGVRGIKGELKIRPETDNPDRFNVKSEVWIDKTKYVIQKSQLNQSKNIIYLDIGFKDRSSAENNIGKLIKVPITMLPQLDDGKYYQFEIIGIEVYDESNNKIGKLTEILPNQNNDNYIIVNKENKEIIIPSNSEWVKKIDICNNIMTVKLPKYI